MCKITSVRFFDDARVADFRDGNLFDVVEEKKDFKHLVFEPDGRKAMKVKGKALSS